ncbi:o-succinylbenzoate--CoA ligase [Vallitalea guaymasensis]|uniref:O-succinylbenzoate--CoA ligase n=1 Tax=Vallitalea guaymasensis TaxID=1185412 RepID=A0A8J8MCK2_9FIRM|nr:o-succinylbenzoate--CoA ligase [Vallitalea guaymasensis]QUH30466.1 o-succinylbenzoate--CoA ligase [Vallitalea guaymasensis]
MNQLYKHSQTMPDKKFINSLTYRQVYTETNKLTIKLKKYIGDNNRVAIISNNSVEFAMMLLALMNLEVETLLLNSMLKNKEIKEQIDELDISVIFSSDNRYISFKEVFGTQITEPYESDITNVHIDGNMNKYKDENYESDKVLFIMNTSATTGRFKSVPITINQITSHVQASKKSLGYCPDDNWLLVLPMFHVGGLMVLLRSLYNGTAITILEKFDEDKVIYLINNNKVNMVSMVPTMLRRIIDRIEKHNLRVMLLGGEFIEDDLINKSVKLNVSIYKSYGMTETTSQVVNFNVLDNLDKLKSVGKPMEHVDIKINTDKFLEHTKDGYPAGEITIKSSMLMKGYLNKDGLSGYFCTGDIGYFDDDGFLYILDRRSNLIISGGENIYPKEIENILYNNPHVNECAVISKRDSKWGYVPVLYIVTVLSEDNIIEYLKSQLANYKIPKEIIFRESLPKNSTGKIMKKALRSCEYEDKES